MTSELLTGIYAVLCGYAPKLLNLFYELVLGYCLPFKLIGGRFSLRLDIVFYYGVRPLALLTRVFSFIIDTFGEGPELIDVCFASARCCCF